MVARSGMCFATSESEKMEGGEDVEYWEIKDFYTR